MFVEPPVVEQVYHVDEMQPLLKRHFEYVYRFFTVSRLIPEACSDIVYGVQRCLSGIAAPFQNALFGIPQAEDWDACIEEQLAYFKKVNMPFVWYVDMDASPEFEQKLLAHGFTNGGVFRAVSGPLNKSLPSPKVPDGYTLEKLKEDPASLDEFNILVCDTFGIEPMNRVCFKKTLQACSQANSHNWVVRKKGKIVSTLSTMIDGDLVSFWNGATLPEERRHGLSTALR
ncbi:MAG: hypothetical protein KGQ49_05370, partial [Verrucomicrobia bacterium]|nr:hypothetical protein [Verrucomicrobiota bacterium]